MTKDRLIIVFAATGALMIAAPALAQTASPDPVFESVPVVQPLPGTPTATVSEPLPPPAVEPVEHVTIHATAIHDAVPPIPPTPPIPPSFHGDGFSARHAAANGADYSPAARPMFDRDAWLADCRERIRGIDPDDRARVIGGLLGAIAGGVIGNRVWDSHRLAGTLLGASAGGLAGAAIGSTIDSANARGVDDECAYSLDRYTAGPYGGYPAYGYGYPGVAYVPVLVQVPQRAIVHEYVTEELVDDPAPVTRTRTITRTKTVRHPSPPGKRTKLIETK